MINPGTADAWTPKMWREPRSALRKAMARRRSPLGSLERLPEQIVLSILAQLPRHAHDSVADSSCGMRRLMRSERFLQTRRADGILEEAFVVYGMSGLSLAMVSDRVWRELPSMPPELRAMECYPRGARVCAIGSEMFVAGGLAIDGER